MINTLLRLCLLMLSNLGYWTYFHKKWEINVYFLPAFTIAVQVTALFLPGILNVLDLAAWAIYLLGFVLLVSALRQEKWRLLKPCFTWGYGLFAVGLLLVALCVHGRLFTWIDCFTHWAVATRNMLEADQFPTFAQSAVEFTSYPVGSTTYIYYFCKMTSQEEDIQMLAQAFAMLAMLLPLFSCGKGGKGIWVVFLGLLANFLLCYNIPITEILVDTLVPLTAMAGILFVHQGCQKREPEGIGVYASVPLFFFVVNIKNTGIFFAAIGMVLLWIREKRNNRRMAPVLWSALILLAGLFLWYRHCDYVFLSSASSQHALTVRYISSRIAERSFQDVSQIVCNFVSHLMRRSAHAWLLLWLCAAGTLMGLAAVPGWKKRFAELALFSVGVYVLYAACVAGMYAFSMGVKPALGLASFDRYMQTIDIALYYLFAAVAMAAVDNCAKQRLRAAAAAAMTVLMVATWKIPRHDVDNIFQIEYDPQMRLELRALLDEYGVAQGFSYLLCYTGEETVYPLHVCKYFLNTSQVKQITVTESAQMEIEREYDYIILFGEENTIVNDWISQHYPQQAGKKVIQCFK